MINGWSVLGTLTRMGGVDGTRAAMNQHGVEVLSDLRQLEQTAGAWDALAVETSHPYCAPGWALPWWSLARPPRAKLRAVALRDGLDLVGLAPLYLCRDVVGIVRAHLLADTASSYIEPLVKPELSETMALAIATVLSSAGARADVLSLGPIPRSSPWPALLTRSWPGRQPQLSLVKSMNAPYVDIPIGGFDDWLGSRSANFRQQVGRRRRGFIKRGGSFVRASSADEVRLALEDFVRLHALRWNQRGGSQALTEPIAHMLQAATNRLDPRRLQLWTAHLGDFAIGSALFVTAGSEVHYWLGGFDDTYGHLSPSLLLLVECIRHAGEEGHCKLVLGPGAQPYKYRLATGEDILDWIDIVPHNGRYPYVRLCQSPYDLYRYISTRTPPRLKTWLRSSVAGVLGEHRER